MDGATRRVSVVIAPGECEVRGEAAKRAWSRGLGGRGQKSKVERERGVERTRAREHG